MAKAAAIDTHRALAREIVRRLRDVDQAIGSPVSELGLSETLGVSRSPVRGAIQILEAEGIVTRGSNKRLTLVRLPSTDEESVANDEESGAADQLYWQIARDRLNDGLGAHVLEMELLRRYDVGRSLLRRAMRQIIVEGWAEQLPTGGWRFLSLIDGPQSYDESYRFRRAIEPAALLEPDFLLPPAIANRLRREQDELLATVGSASPRQVFEYNSGFHLSLMQASNNRFFADAALRITRLRRVVGYVIALDHSRTAYQSEEHLAILSRIEDGDRVAAARLMVRHLRAGQKSKAALLSNQTLTITGPTPVVGEQQR